MFVVFRLELVLRSKMRVRILRAERVEFTRKRQAREYSPLVKILPSIIFHRNQTRSAVLRRLASIVVVRRSFLSPSTPCFARARRRKQLSTVSYSLTRRFDQKKKDFPCGSPSFLVQVGVPTWTQLR